MKKPIVRKIMDKNEIPINGDMMKEHMWKISHDTLLAWCVVYYFYLNLIYD